MPYLVQTYEALAAGSDHEAMNIQMKLNEWESKGRFKLLAVVPQFRNLEADVPDGMPAPLDGPLFIFHKDH